MTVETYQPDTRNKGASIAIGDATLPLWITPELVQLTLKTWQPHYKRTLTIADAMDILMNTGRLIEAVQEFQDDEEVSGSSPRI